MLATTGANHSKTAATVAKIALATPWWVTK